MGPNQEIFSDRYTEVSETNELFFTRLDVHFGDAVARLRHAIVSRLAYGDLHAYNEAKDDYNKAITIEKENYERLAEIATSDDPVARKASKLKRFLTYRDSQESDPGSDSMRNKKDFMHRVRTIRANLHLVNTKGSEELKNALALEADSTQRKMIYDALCAQNDMLGRLVLDEVHRNQESYSTSGRSYISNLIHSYDSEMPFEDFHKMLVGVTSLLLPIISEDHAAIAKISGQHAIDPWDYPYWCSRTRTISEHMVGKHTKSLERTIDALGHRDAYDRLTVIIPQDRYDVARCIEINPPDEITILFHESKGNDLHDVITPHHETGHGIHAALMRPDLAHIERLWISPWNEAMAIIYQSLVIEPGVLVEELDNDGLHDLEIRYTHLQMGYITTILCNLSTEEILYGDEPATESVILTKLSAVQRKFHPLLRDFHPYWWANDMYIVEYPFYGINYLYGEMIAAQIRAWWKRTHEEPLLSKAFGDFLRDKCYAPGNSVPWRQLLRDITGEDVNPQYLVDELSFAMRPS